MGRKILQDFTFSDGSIIPAGNTVFVASYAMHHDGVSTSVVTGNFIMTLDFHKALYDNAEQFDGFRFARMRESEGESTKHQMVSLSQDFVAFGNGRHAW
jgi:cytochrome P450